MTRSRWFLLLAAALLAAFPPGPVAAGEDPVDVETLRDAYVYLLGRAIVVRQERTDLAEEGIDYNVIKYNPVGRADFVNPNLDVAYLEAWIAVDDATPALLEVPQVTGRYYTAQIMDEWGEVITNINERNYPFSPHGRFAFVAPGSRAAVPEDAVRIELHSNKAKMLARVELTDDVEGAVALQRMFKLRSMGTPKVAPPAPMPAFDNVKLMGVELFDDVEAVLTSAPDVSPIAARMQARARHVAGLAARPAERAALDELIRKDVVPYFLNYAVTKSGVFENSWLGTLGTGNYGSDFWIRTSANLVGIWANNNDEVIYFVATRDEQGRPLNGDHAYVLHFDAQERPDQMVHGYWSVILVDIPDYRVVPNRLDRFNFNSYSLLKLDDDGSLSIRIAAEPGGGLPESNWLPAPAGKPFSLTFRTYVPKEIVKQGDWFPPALRRIP